MLKPQQEGAKQSSAKEEERLLLELQWNKRKRDREKNVEKIDGQREGGGGVGGRKKEREED